MTLQRVLIVVLTGMVVFLGIRVRITAQSLATVREVLNDVWDRAGDRLMTTPGVGAQGTIETEQTIFNDVWDRTNHMLRTSGTGGAGSSTPGGSDTFVQFNDVGVLSGDSGLVFNKVSNVLTVTGGIVGNVTGNADTATVAGSGDSASGFFTSGTLENARTTGTTSATANTLVLRDAQGGSTFGLVSTTGIHGGCSSANGTDDYACNLSPSITGLVTQACYSFIADVGNEEAASINFNAIGGKSIVKGAGLGFVALETGDITAGSIVHVCFDGVNMQCVSGCNGNTVVQTQPVTTGIRTTATTVESLRPAVVELSGARTLGVAHTVCAVGAGPASFTLPLASDVMMPGVIETIICDQATTSLTMLPSGSDTINRVAAASAAITGLDSAYLCKRTGDTNWKCTTDAPVALADLGGESVVCKGSGGDVNNSSSGSGSFFNHSLDCDIPANTLRANSVLTACVQWEITTGSTAPQMQHRLQLGGTTVYNAAAATTPSASITEDSTTTCYVMHFAASTGTILTSYTSPIGTTGAWSAASERNSTAQPVNVDSAVELSLIFQTSWNSAGTGVNTITQNGIYVKLHR